MTVPTRWQPPGPRTMTGRTALVTGANSGIGWEVSTALAAAGAHVLMACRSTVRGEQARDRVRTAVPDASVELVALDLADLAAVRTAASAVLAGHPRLDLLVANAGVMATGRRTTADGFELQLGTNHLGHFALTGLLLPALQRVADAGDCPSAGAADEVAPGPRVVTVSSLVHRRGRLDRADLMRERRYRRWEAYGQAKLANLLFAFELDRRLRATGSASASVAAHPGVAATHLVASGPLAGLGPLTAVADRVGALVLQSPRQGALPVLRAATDPQVPGGAFLGPAGWGGTRGAPVEVSSSVAARDAADARWLWEESERLTGVRYLPD